MKINTAPVFMHFPAKGKPKKADSMDIHRLDILTLCQHQAKLSPSQKPQAPSPFSEKKPATYNKSTADDI